MNFWPSHSWGSKSVSTTRRKPVRTVSSTGLQVAAGAPPPPTSASRKQAGKVLMPHPRYERSMSCGFAKTLVVTSK